MGPLHKPDAPVAEGEVKAGKRKSHLPKPTKLQGSGKSAADYVAEGRR